jgi:CheY-like chemotaxis protein
LRRSADGTARKTRTVAGMPHTFSRRLRNDRRPAPIDYGRENGKEIAPERSVPAIVLTAYGSEEDRKTCLDAGFETHLTKPVETRYLGEAIRNIMQKQSINS